MKKHHVSLTEQDAADIKRLYSKEYPLPKLSKMYNLPVGYLILILCYPRRLTYMSAEEIQKLKTWTNK